MALIAPPWIMHLSQIAAASAITAIWEGVLLVTALWLCMNLFPRMSATFRFSLWMIAFALLLILPFVHLGNPGMRQEGLRPLHVEAGWSLAIATLWAAASVIFFARMVWQAITLHQMWKRAIPLQGPFNSRIEQAVGEHKVQLCCSEDVAHPSIIGYFSPRILLPARVLRQATESELEHIVLHEMEHLCRHDDWLNLLQKLSLVVFPLNPALLWIERRLCLEREMACDDRVIARTRSPRGYASCLVNLAEGSLLRKGISLSLGVIERQSQLSQRVFRILNPKNQMARWQQVALSAAVVLALGAGAVRFAQSPQLVSFASANDLDALAPLPSTANSTHNLPKAFGVQATFVKATMSSPPVHPASLRPTQQSIAKKPLRIRQRQVEHQRIATPNLVRISAPSEPQQFILTVFHDSHFSSSYAAFPIGTGWLLIQL